MLTSASGSLTVFTAPDRTEVIMNRLVAALAIAPLLILTSCQRKDAHAPPAPVVADARSALAITPGLPLWSLDPSGLSLLETIPIGEKLALLGQTEKAAQGGKERSFLRVRRASGTDGWVRADFVVSSAILAVITTDGAVIYSSASNTAATTESIPRMTLVAIASDTAGMGFIRVTCYDQKAKMLLKGVLLRNEGVSALPADVQAAILLQLAASAKNEKQRQAFLGSAITDYPDSIFLTDLRQALNPQAAAAVAPAAPAAPDTAPAADAMRVSGDAAKVFDAPDADAGKVLATLPRGQQVQTEEVTVQSFTVGGQTAPWYRIRDPAGWVFGGVLQPAP
jgi:hypothetical protein